MRLPSASTRSYQVVPSTVNCGIMPATIESSEGRDAELLSPHVIEPFACSEKSVATVTVPTPSVLRASMPAARTAFATCSSVMPSVPASSSSPSWPSSSGMATPRVAARSAAEGMASAAVWAVPSAPVCRVQATWEASSPKAEASTRTLRSTLASSVARTGVSEPSATSPTA